MLVERRFYKRYPVSFKFQVVINDMSFSNEAINISTNGIQMLSTGDCVEQFTDPECSIATCQITMPVPNGREPITLDCRLVVNRRLSQLSYLIGLKFISLDPPQQQYIDAWINTAVS